MTAVAPCLESLASFELRIDAALEEARIAPVSTPDAGAYALQLSKGSPLLMGEACPDLDFVSNVVHQLAARLDREATDPALLRLLTWRVLQRVLARAIAELAPVRENWMRAECPTCGSTASMSMLIGTNGSRQRLLACACCLTTWSYKRVGCPYCGNEAPRELGVLHVEQQNTARLDVCESCKGYVKTFVDVFPEDWPTLHLDLLAQERGYKRRGASLYEL